MCAVPRGVSRCPYVIGAKGGDGNYHRGRGWRVWAEGAVAGKGMGLLETQRGGGEAGASQYSNLPTPSAVLPSNSPDVLGAPGSRKVPSKTPSASLRVEQVTEQASVIQESTTVYYSK